MLDKAKEKGCFGEKQVKNSSEQVVSEGDGETRQHLPHTESGSTVFLTVRAVHPCYKILRPCIWKCNRINFCIKLALKSPASKVRTSQQSSEQFLTVQRRGGILAMNTVLCNTIFLSIFSYFLLPSQMGSQRASPIFHLYGAIMSPLQSSSAMSLFIRKLITQRTNQLLIKCYTKFEQSNENVELKGVGMKEQGAQQYTLGLDGP